MEPQFLTVDQFAKASGLSQPTVRRRVQDGSLPSWQPGGRHTRILIPREALEPQPQPEAPPAGPRPRPRSRWQKQLKRSG